MSRWPALLLLVGGCYVTPPPAPPAVPRCVDADADSYCADIDCDDQDAARHPGAAETLGDGADSDCDGYD